MVEDLIKRLRMNTASWDHQREAADLIEQQAARLTALESELDALLAAAGKEAVAWQVRRGDGRIDGVPIQWENCTKELYDATLATGRYAGFERGPKCEVRALYDAPTPAVDTRVKPVAWTLADELARRESTCKAHLWFSDPVNTAWIPLYTAPTAALEKPSDALYTMDQMRDYALAFHKSRLDARGDLTAKQKWDIAERVHSQCEALKPHATFRSAASQAINDTIAALSQKAGEQQ